MRLLSEQDVEALIDPQLAMETTALAYRRHAANKSAKPGRLDVSGEQPPFRALVLAGTDGAAFGLKLNLHSYASGDSLDRRSASLLTIWDTALGQPRAAISTLAFNGHRTAAGYAVAARALARPDAQTLVVFGAGRIAGPSIQYLAGVRPIERVVLVDPVSENIDRLVKSLRGMPSLQKVKFDRALSAREATRQADILLTTTTSLNPVFPGASVQPGTLVILGGANRPHAREADDDFAARALFYTDDTEICLEKAGDLAIPLKSGILSKDQIQGEIGELLSSRFEQLNQYNHIVTFKSTGLSIQDIALAEALLQRAKEKMRGLEFDPIRGCHEGIHQ